MPRNSAIAIQHDRLVVDAVRPGAMGDVLMCTPVLRELKRRRPNSRIRFYTDYPSLVRGLPYIDEVMAPKAAPRNATHFEYESAEPHPPHVHLSEIIGDGFGVRIREKRPDCVIDSALVKTFRSAWQALPRPHIIINRHASSWTPNKDWPEPHWAELIRRLSQDATIIEIGAFSGARTARRGSYYVDLRGRTTTEELVAAIAACDLHVGPPSGPVHIAAAAGKRSVVIISGYEGPSNTAYPSDIIFYSPVECAPCWLRTPCPHALKCLNAISPDDVERAVLSLWDQIRAVQ
jgi:ADP-heptose:LPS heptosyltransferase